MIDVSLIFCNLWLAPRWANTHGGSFTGRALPGPAVEPIKGWSNPEIAKLVNIPSGKLT